MKKIKVLIVDDSAFARQQIRSLLETNNEFEVVGIARNGEDAIKKVCELNPDLITMDIEMQTMNGIEALKHIMKTNPKPIVMVSEYVKSGAKYALESLQHGAVDCILKGEILSYNPNPQAIRNFFEKLKVATKANVRILDNKERIMPKNLKKDFLKKEIDMVFIGCSTGGPNALREILPKIPSTFKLPILVAQHMPKGFTSLMANSFEKTCQLPVKEVEHGEIVEKGVIYIAPAGYQTTIYKRGNYNIFSVEDNEKYKQVFSPAVDVSLFSLVSIYKERLLTVILTGMGQDGLKGCREAKKQNGYIVTQTKESCVVYGMPKSVDEAGLSDEQVDLYDVYKRIVSIAKKE
ncbi:chemotaxis-specific protein-glutamate methyltransferase CheB [Bacillus cereus group sp. TH152-1LC]|uniref:chemotaxis-specific protein-glutamate methyltransferase CheB n=1 Tax=Bacillus cereus group sp. TH152-1LC TaxID=3018060 RepID=UPI0022DEF8F6|nr:chemotaxis-specific protein-glutamate methyltransferase CheB [Bacillus cereus group sp. TH152-1LC]MDA1674982.1 chemotaxis-specific protein-glutamate methyltransferase CheB [Bacillus cereus group sp. TH152-1LC]